MITHFNVRKVENGWICDAWEDTMNEYDPEKTYVCDSKTDLKNLVGRLLDAPEPKSNIVRGED